LYTSIGIKTSPAADIVTATVTRIVDEDDDRTLTDREPVVAKVRRGVIEKNTGVWSMFNTQRFSRPGISRSGLMAAKNSCACAIVS
jgi:hypothetical protein